MTETDEDPEMMQERLEAEALSLLSRVHADAEAPLDAMLALEEWEALSEDHRAAMARVTHAWSVAGAIDAAPLAATAPALPTPRSTRARQRLPRSRRIGWSVGAAAAAMAAAGAFLLIRSAPPPEPAATVYATARGETRTLPLADGSRIVLGADSRVLAGIDGDDRALRLIAGQALFKVRHDPSRPFTVTAGDTVIRDVGTVFSVTRRDDAIIVGVAEGVVEAAAPGAAAARLVEGQQLRVTAGGRMTLTTATPDLSTSWTTGRLRYDRAPLSDVVADLNRYAATPLHVTDAATARLSYSGTVRADAIDEWLGALPYAFPIVVRRRGNAVEIARQTVVR